MPVYLMTAIFQPAFQAGQASHSCIYNCAIYKPGAHLARALVPAVTHVPLGSFPGRLVLKQRKEQNL